MRSPRPAYIEDVAPERRLFPASWRDAAIRDLFDDERGGVVCAICQGLARRPAELRGLHCDHIVPYAKGGRTTWENLQLLCAPCNWSKNSRM